MWVAKGKGVAFQECRKTSRISGQGGKSRTCPAEQRDMGLRNLEAIWGTHVAAAKAGV